MHNLLAFDVGGTKTAWAVVTEDGKIHAHGEEETPQDRDEFVSLLTGIAKKHPEVKAIGAGIPGPIGKDKQTVLFCTNIPSLSRYNLGEALSQATGKPVSLDNDARCALIGEAWHGAASDTRSAVMLTLGTGVGGAVMQRGTILPASADVSLEISHLIADPTDFFPGNTGPGTVEAMLGGKNIEARYGVSMHDMAVQMKAGKAEAKEFWSFIQHSFAQCLRAIHEVYGCRMVIVGGRGAHDLKYYLGDTEPPCEVHPAKLGEDAALYGASRLALEAANQAAKDWDEE